MSGQSFEAAAAEGRVWACPSCDGDREFVQPPGVVWHTEDAGECRERACAACGRAVFSAAALAAAALPVSRAA